LQTNQNRKSIATLGIDAAGKPIWLVFEQVIEDGKPHPVTGSRAYDASIYTRVDDYTIEFSRMKAGKVVQTGTSRLSRDGGTLTNVTTGSDANGRQIKNIAIYDRL
jgi:hypothetical protein